MTILFCCLVEGPCLLHTTTGNLLRTLRGPGECVRPRLLKLTRDGLVLVNYTDGTGHLAVFTINGKLLSEKRLDDQMLVCIAFAFFPILQLWLIIRAVLQCIAEKEGATCLDGSRVSMG